MEAYLDNAATTHTLTEVADKVYRVMTEDFGNPSSLHKRGFEAEKYIKQARQIIADTLKADSKSIVFTSGGTESNNTALIGVSTAKRRVGKHIITTKIEHPSILNTVKYLSEVSDCDITYLDTDRNGLVDTDTLKAALKSDTVLVSIMTVNNEVGTIQDIQGLVSVVKEFNSDIVFHTDAVQAYGKLPIYPKKWGVDLMSISGHKLHGPKGVGVLYIADGVRLHPLIHGGGQQNDIRSGTENVPGITGLSLAAKIAYDNIDDSYKHVLKLRKRLTEGIADIPDTIVHGDMSVSSPYVVSIGFEGVRAEVLLHALEDKGIYVSSGSACASNHPGISDTLTAMGTDKRYLDSTVRFSFSRYTTVDEIDMTLEALHELVPTLRRFVRR